MNEAWLAASAVTWVLVILAIVKSSAREKVVVRIARLEAKVDMLLKHAGLEYDPLAKVSESVAEALHRGEKIEAVKRYREETGVGLAEAKQAVEEIQGRMGT